MAGTLFAYSGLTRLSVLVIGDPATMPTLVPVFRVDRIILLLSIVIWSVVAVASQPESEVTVLLSNGRQSAAALDGRTDGDHLWLRFHSDTTTLLRAIPWDEIVSAHYEGRELTREEFPAVAAKVQAPAAVARRSRATWGHAPRVTSVRFDAFLANWDGDVEADGLIIDIYPLDRNGQVIPASGILEVDLIASRAGEFNLSPRNSRQTLGRLGHWTMMVRTHDVDSSGATFRLPFQAAHPEFDTNLGSHGLVHVRLVVPGHGVFEESVDPVRIRRFSPLRDALERSDGRRFFPLERTGRGKR